MQDRIYDEISKELRNRGLKYITINEVSYKKEDNKSYATVLIKINDITFYTAIDLNNLEYYPFVYEVTEDNSMPTIFHSLTKNKCKSSTFAYNFVNYYNLKLSNLNSKLEKQNAEQDRIQTKANKYIRQLMRTQIANIDSQKKQD